MRKLLTPLLQMSYKWIKLLKWLGPCRALQACLASRVALSWRQATTRNRLSCLAGLHRLARSRHFAGLVPKRCLNIALNKLED